MQDNYVELWALAQVDENYSVGFLGQAGRLNSLFGQELRDEAARKEVEHKE